jgi:hypothetical protein
MTPSDLNYFSQFDEVVPYWDAEREYGTVDVEGAPPGFVDGCRQRRTQHLHERRRTRPGSSSLGT